MTYDFIEIGTSCFETLIEKASDTDIGLSVEPLKHYLDKLPDKPGVQKVALAISCDGQRTCSQVYHIPESVIRERGLPDWLIGCNSVGAPHPQHERLGILNLVQKYEVIAVPIGWLFQVYDVDAVNYLKIDVEGQDAAILLQLHEYIVERGRYSQWPKKIDFESNELVPAAQVKQVIQQYTAIGYKLMNTGHDTILCR